MSDFDELRRGNYRPDAVGKASRQEAEELSRGHYHPDARAKAAEQELADEREVRVQAPQPHRTKLRDRSGNTVLRRGAASPGALSGGGADVSQRGVVATVASRAIRACGRGLRSVAAGFSERRAARRGRAAYDRAYGGGAGGSLRPRIGCGGVLLIAVVLAFVLLALVCRPIDRAIAFPPEEREGLSSELSGHIPGFPYYVLALGSDAREGETVSRTDTIVLVRVDPLGGKLTMVSIPRDTMVELEGYGTQKINAAYAFGGVAGAVRAVRDLTGAPISHVALVHFDGVESLVDYLGGVTVDVPVPINDPSYTGLVMPAGEQHMDGHTALLFSRVRYGFDLGDYQRQIDQRILMEAIMRDVLALPPWRLPGVVGHMGGMLSTTMRMRSILPLMLRLKFGGHTVYQATIPSEPQMIDGVSYVVADQAGVEEMMRVVAAGGDPGEL